MVKGSQTCNVTSLSLLLPELSKFPLDDGAPLDAGNHDLEAVKVVQPSSPGAHSKLAAPRAVLPLVVNITGLHGFLEFLLLGHPGDVDGDVGEGETLEVDLSPHHVGGVYQRPVLVHHVHDDHQLPVLRAIVDQGNAPDLNKASEHHGCCWKSKQTDKALAMAELWRLFAAKELTLCPSSLFRPPSPNPNSTSRLSRSPNPPKSYVRIYS